MKKMKLFMLYAILVLFFPSCEIDPILHLHRKNYQIEFPIIDLELNVIWDYRYIYDTEYDWKREWYYGDDPTLFGGVGDEVLGYHQPTLFELRRYYTGDVAYAPHTRKEEFHIEGYSFTSHFDWGFHDILVWNTILPSGNDEAISIIIDESQTLDSVYAYTNMTTKAWRAPNISVGTRPRYQPEELFSAYDQAEEIDRNLTGFTWDEERQMYVKTLKANLKPLTYIYLTQIILHNNRGRIIGVDGDAVLSGMAVSTNLNSGITGPDAIPVSYSCGFKQHIDVDGEDVDIVGGRVLTFGICGLNPNNLTRAQLDGNYDPNIHYIDCNVLFNTGSESKLTFDVTDQVKTLFKGGVITVHINVDDIEIPTQPQGSGFDAMVKDEEEETYEFDM